MEGISVFLANQQAYFDNASRDIKANPSERALQEKNTERQVKKELKKKEILVSYQSYRLS